MAKIYGVQLLVTWGSVFSVFYSTVAIRARAVPRLSTFDLVPRTPRAPRFLQDAVGALPLPCPSNKPELVAVLKNHETSKNRTTTPPFPHQYFAATFAIHWSLLPQLDVSTHTKRWHHGHSHQSHGHRGSRVYFATQQYFNDDQSPRLTIRTSVAIDSASFVH